jgi:hypothetical protein
MLHLKIRAYSDRKTGVHFRGNTRAARALLVFQEGQDAVTPWKCPRLFHAEIADHGGRFAGLRRRE